MKYDTIKMDSNLNQSDIYWPAQRALTYDERNAVRNHAGFYKKERKLK